MKKTKKIKSASDMIKSRSTSVLTSSAQNTTLCDLESVSDKQLQSFINKVLECTRLSSVDQGIMLLCLCEGLRISEVLSVTASSWRAGHKVFILGKKGSFDRVVTVRYFCEELVLYTRCCGPLHLAGSRYYYYREMKKLGIIFKSQNSSKASVTHAGRHLLADDLFQRGNDIELSQRTLGHKKTSSTKHYVEEKKQKR
jgi:site-specific recombinase XerD